MSEDRRALAYYFRARCGDHVYDVNDPRHVARLSGIRAGTAFVQFLETGWHGEINVSDMRKAEES